MLYYYRARYYDPTIGRFLSEDPIGFNGGINLYTYVGNRPVNFIDPFGLQEMFPLDPNIPFPYIPSPDSGGCFGTLAFFTFSWDSNKPTVTTFSVGGASLGGGFTVCYKMTCDDCPKGPSGGSAGPPFLGFSHRPFSWASGTFLRGVGIGGGINGDSLCFTFGAFGAFTPFNISLPFFDF